MSDEDASPQLGDTDPTTGNRDRVGVIIPIKSFNTAKGRLAQSLSPTERDDLARRMATRVIEAARPLPTWIVCDDHGVAHWVMEAGAQVLWRSAPGLNPAVTASVEFLGRLGFDRIIIAHGDLPLATNLRWVGDFDGVSIVPDRWGEGTNVMAVPTNCGFVFAYGTRSAPKHQREAERLGLAVRVVEDSDLGWDIDTPDDLTALADRPAPTTTPRGTP